MLVDIFRKRWRLILIGSSVLLAVTVVVLLTQFHVIVDIKVGRETVGPTEPLHYLIFQKQRKLTVREVEDALKGRQSVLKSFVFQGDTLLAEAAAYCDLEVVRFLIDQGADPNGLVITAEGDRIMTGSPLRAALVYERLDVADLLLRRGASLEHVPGVLSPLHSAASNQQPAIARFLVEHGANINEVDESGLTPLHWAVSGEGDNDQIVRTLLDLGADWQYRDRDGHTALDIAQRKGHQRQAAVLSAQR